MQQIAMPTKHLKLKTITPQHYSPFGMVTPGRSFTVGDGYRFGFNGQEKIDEVYGSSNLNTAMFWEYDTRLGKRWNLDPVIKPNESPYATFANNPILFIDPSGKDTTLYAMSNGKKIDTKINEKDKKTPIWVVNDQAEGYDPNDPWKTATPLKYHSGKKNYDQKVTGITLRESHPLKNKGWNAFAQVYEEDLLDMTEEFNDDVADDMGYFMESEEEFDVVVGTSPGLNYVPLAHAAELKWFASQVCSDCPYDLKSTSRQRLSEDFSYGAEYIGEYSFYNGMLMHYDDYGNFAFGVWGRSFGLSVQEISKAANIEQIFDSGSNDPNRDQFMIQQGFNNMYDFQQIFLETYMGGIDDE